MIKSTRTFGVEIEMGAKNYKDIDVLRSKLGRSWRFDDDGSIRHIVKNPVELVSPILQGKEGEDSLRKVCMMLKDMGFDADHLACGTHVHLGANDFKPREDFIVLNEKEYQKYMSNSKNTKDIIEVMFVDTNALADYYRLKTRKLLTTRYRKFAMNTMINGYRDGEVDRDTKFAYRLKTQKKDGVDVRYYWEVDVKLCDIINKEIRDKQSLLDKQMSQFRASIISDEQVEEYRTMENTVRNLRNEYTQRVDHHFVVGEGRYVVRTLSHKPTRNLINVFLFYYVFDKVFSGMLPPDRRENNSYCVPLSDTFTFEEIDACTTQEDFEKLWYKERNVQRLASHKSQHYNDSRYHNVNFHSLFNRHGTIEIRSHSGTTNPNRIILWTALHQSVLDAISSEKVDRSSITKAHFEGLPLDKLAVKMCDMLELDTKVRAYVYRLLNYFSDTELSV